MTKKEVIWREILVQKRQNNQIKFTQKGLAEKLGFSVSTVFNALKNLRETHIVEVRGRFFVLNDYRKLLYFWASERNPAADFIFKIFVDKPTREIEASMIPEATPALYSGYKFLYGSAPADYDHLYFYLKKEDLNKFSERLAKLAPFVKTRVHPNVFVIEQDNWFAKYQQPLPEQIFVDIWNASEWYAKDFLAVLERELFKQLAEFWHDNITDRSFYTLQSLKKEYDFVLIGGWAVFLYTKSLKSRDIEELSLNKKQYADFKKSVLKDLSDAENF